jgi:glycosyltransferase involved in cell wall biosynthesis
VSVHLLLSALSLKPGAIGGVEFMIRNLAKGLASLPDVRLTIASPPTAGGWPTNVHVQTWSGANRFVSEIAEAPRLAWCGGADGIIFPNYFGSPITFGAKSLVVIHDLLYRHAPQVFTAKKRLWLRACHRLAVETASRIVTTSETVARDLRTTYGRRVDGRVTTIPIGIDWSRFDTSAPQQPRPWSGRPYLLSVAAEWPHKNVATLVRAYAKYRPQLKDCALVLVGQTRDRLRGDTVSTSPPIAALIDALGLGDSVFATGHIPDGELGHLYRGATVFVFPSTFEGFGMPPVEALGLGVPVLSTRCGAIEETTLGLATYVGDPFDVDEFGSLLVRMTADPGVFAAATTDVATLREFYSPVRIAALYRDAVLN